MTADPLRQETVGGLPFVRRRLLGTGRNPVYDGLISYPDGRQQGYAVKLTFDQNDPAFGSECELLKDTRIKGAVPSYGPYDYVGPHGEQGLAVVSPRIRGQNFDAYVRGAGPLDRDQAIMGLAQAARSLHSAHAQGIVHLDMKPSNIMREASSGRLLIIDWELAQRDGTAISQGLGTAQYLPPEVARMRPPPVNGKMDVYALGNAIAEAHTGQATRQFPRDLTRLPMDERVEAENRFIASDKSQPRVADPHFNLILQRATMPDARQRATALDVMTDLAAYRVARQQFDDEDRAAVIDHLVKRASAFDRRNPVLDAAAAQGLLAEVPREHANYRHLAAISQLGPALPEQSSAPAPSQQQAPPVAPAQRPASSPSRGMARG